ncbi:MAG: VOC family protein [Actinomycetota bacterium]
MAENPGTAIVMKTIFPVADMAEAVAFYRSLGFAVEQYDDGYAWVTHRGGEILHLGRVDTLDAAANHASAYVHVQDADAWHAGWTSDGIAATEVIDQPWGMREFTLTDPAGNLLRVGQNL